MSFSSRENQYECLPAPSGPQAVMGMHLPTISINDQPKPWSTVSDGGANVGRSEAFLSATKKHRQREVRVHLTNVGIG